MSTADVTVLGAGVFGLAVGWACARRGARVRVADRVGVGAGASGGLVGALAPHVPDGWTEGKALQLRALLDAEAYWAEVATAGNTDPGFARCGRLQPLADSAALARARTRAASAAVHWGGAARWEVIPATGAAWEPVSASGWLVHDTLSARLAPRRACAALAAAIRARGGTVLVGTQATAEAEAHPCGALVLATGHAGLSALGAGRGVKGQALLVAHDAGRVPLIGAHGLWVVPHADGTIAIGSTSEETWTSPDAPDVQVEALHARAVALCPALADAPVLERWAGVRPRADRGQPLLGALPERRGCFIANGGFKTGFALAPLAGEMLATLVLEGRNDIPCRWRTDARFSLSSRPRNP